jgi:hypothetical protein
LLDIPSAHVDKNVLLGCPGLPRFFFFAAWVFCLVSVQDIFFVLEWVYKKGTEPHSGNVTGDFYSGIVDDGGAGAADAVVDGDDVTVVAAAAAPEVSGRSFSLSKRATMCLPNVYLRSAGT